jgi:hypothetical protein
MKDLYAFPAIIVQRGHNHKPSMKLYWTKDELSFLLLCDDMWSFLKILKYLHFADNQNPPTQDREEPDYDYGKSDKYFRF